MSSTPNSNETNIVTPPETPSTWDQGWYIFENGQVVGPLNAKEAFSSESSALSGQARMVSRKGFTQWYPVRDFAEIYAMIGSYSDQLSSSVAASPRSVSDFEPRGKVVGVTTADSLASQSPGFDSVQAAQNEVVAAAQNKPKDVRPSAAAVPPIAARTPTIAKNVSDRMDADSGPNDRIRKKLVQKQVKAARAAAKSQKLMDRNLFAQQYFSVQARLRLGRVVSPVLGAFVYTPLTLGGYWWDWFARSSEEVAWHLNGSTKVNFVLPVWTCMIPGLHLVLAYFLARMVCQMESENGYRSVSPTLATLAAIFPPLYITMIQSALNRHWRLHVYHSAIPR